jgi:hypothetical protein
MEQKVNFNTPAWGIQEITGYEPRTTFWQDFSIADSLGASAIMDTYNRSFNAWKDNYEYLTELVMVLNWKCWYWYDQGNENRSRFYSELFYRARDYALENLMGEELHYFLKTTD